MRPLTAFLMGLLMAPAPTAAQEREERVRDLRAHLDQMITVKGRTGIIVEAEEKEGWRVFTLRDDYGDQVKVHTRQDYPLLGVTYRVTGIPRIEEGQLFLEEKSRQRLYPPGKNQSWLILVIVALVAGGVIYVRKLLQDRQEPRPIWGRAEVIAGPDQGKEFALRNDTVLVGRSEDPEDPHIGINLQQGRCVSREHGFIFWQGKEVFYQDNHSANGSSVDGQRVQSGQKVRLKPGAILKLGPYTELRVQSSVTEKTMRWDQYGAITQRAPKDENSP